MIRRFFLIACAAALVAAGSAVGASAGVSSSTVVIHVCSTSVDWANAQRVWADPAGGMHVRGLPIYNEMYVDSSERPDCAALSAGGTSFGPLFYSEWANLLTDGSSTAGCVFDMSASGYGDFQGECNGSLASGHLVGYGGGGATLTGTYELIALAPDLSSSEYRLTITFNAN